MSKITASCKFGDHALCDIPVINPGGWFGKAWLVEVGGSYTPLWLVVEADTAGEIHVHTKPDDQEFEYDEGTTTLKLTVDKPGLVDVESHDLEKVIVQLEVA